MNWHRGRCLLLAVVLSHAAPMSGAPIALHPEDPHYFLFRGQPTILITSAEHSLSERASLTFVKSDKVQRSRRRRARRAGSAVDTSEPEGEPTVTAAPRRWLRQGPPTPRRRDDPVDAAARRTACRPKKSLGSTCHDPKPHPTVIPGIIDTAMLRSCFGADAANYPEPAAWAEKAVPFLLGLGPKDNGKPMEVPERGGFRLSAIPAAILESPCSARSRSRRWT